MGESVSVSWFVAGTWFRFVDVGTVVIVDL
jgi:hypothetical protein